MSLRKFTHFDDVIAEEKDPRLCKDCLLATRLKTS